MGNVASSDATNKEREKEEEREILKGKIDWVDTHSEL